MIIMKNTTLKILLSLFFLNTLSLYLYFSSHHHHHHLPPQNHHLPPQNHHHHNSFLQNPTKPWPILPSYLPWSHQNALNNTISSSKSCEAYFGNGYSLRMDLLSSLSSSWFRCFYSATLRSSICEGGNIRMNSDKIRMAKGGERLDTVIGRGEDEELPDFEFGAFEVETNGGSKRNGERLVSGEFLDEYVEKGAIQRHTMRDLIASVRLVEASEFHCSQWVEEPTLLVTRFEYANLFHTVTDWYSAYVAARVTGVPNRPRLVFVDGHCQAPLEETWKALFSSITYAKNFSEPVCFRHAILSPLGYETALFKGLTENINCHGASAHDLWQKPDDQKTARLSEFGEMIRAAFGFPVNRHRSPKRGSGYNVLFVRRENYLAHPRHGGKVQSRLSNEQEVFDAIKRRWASNHLECKVNVINGLFAHMPMKEQIRAIQDASVIVGAHGAGMTHIVSATPETVILEIISSEYIRPHFALIAQWKGLEYHPIYLDGSYADPPVVIDKLSKILRSIGCLKY